MLPTDLRAEHFKGYPEMARGVAIAHLPVLRRLVVPFASLLLREFISYDWKFPAERAELDSDLAFLEKLPSERFTELMRPFRSIRLDEALETAEWVTNPVAFSEKLSAHLWRTKQIDVFRNAAVRYMDERTATTPSRSLPLHRLIVVLVGQGAEGHEAALFRRLRPHGTLFENVDGHVRQVFQRVQQRAMDAPEPFAHWYVDGGEPASQNLSGVTCVSYAGLRKARAIVQKEMLGSFERRTGSEAMRSQLALKRPQELGLPGSVWGHFAMSILTEGSGTQIYSTTFVQWAAREALRRAQPLTLFVRFAPRQRERPMQELLLESTGNPAMDPEGSLVDADMGAYYTWLNAKRLTGADRMHFVAWFEGHAQAIAVGPSMPQGASTKKPISLSELLK